nr:retrotransposon like protein [Tanacetum cinerariifolium]
MKIHESRPTGSAPLPEANMVTYNQSGGRGRGRGSDCGQGHGHGRGRSRGQGRRFGRGHESPTFVHEDNATCIVQVKDKYIKGDKTKHILPKFFFTHDLQKSGDIIIQKILAIHEASRECVWLRSVTQHIRESCGISLGHESPTFVHEDNATCIVQVKDKYIKGDKTKHILPKFFFTHDLQKSGDIIIQKVRSSDNQADLFTKALPTTTFKKLVQGTGMHEYAVSSLMDIAYWMSE